MTDQWVLLCTTNQQNLVGQVKHFYFKNSLIQPVSGKLPILII